MLVMFSLPLHGKETNGPSIDVYMALRVSSNHKAQRIPTLVATWIIAIVISIMDQLTTEEAVITLHPPVCQPVVDTGSSLCKLVVSASANVMELLQAICRFLDPTNVLCRTAACI